MIPMTLAEIARVLDASLDGVPDPEALITGPSAVDSREVAPGGLFAATVGARVDGHDYAANAPSGCPRSWWRTCRRRSACWPGTCSHASTAR